MNHFPVSVHYQWLMNPANAFTARVLNPSSFASHHTANVGSLQRNTQTNILFQLHARNIVALDKCGCQWRNLISRPAIQMPIIPSVAILHSHPEYNEFPHGWISRADECISQRETNLRLCRSLGWNNGERLFRQRCEIWSSEGWKFEWMSRWKISAPGQKLTSLCGLVSSCWNSMMRFIDIWDFHIWRSRFCDQSPCMKIIL